MVGSKIKNIFGDASWWAGVGDVALFLGLSVRQFFENFERSRLRQPTCPRAFKPGHERCSSLRDSASVFTDSSDREALSVKERLR